MHSWFLQQIIFKFSEQKNDYAWNKSAAMYYFC